MFHFVLKASEHADLNFFPFESLLGESPNYLFAARDYGKQEPLQYSKITKFCRGLYCNSHLTRYVISFMKLDFPTMPFETIL